MPLSLRVHNDDHSLIKDEAHFLGTKVSTLVRWFAVHGAQQLRFVRTGHAPVVRA